VDRRRWLAGVAAVVASAACAAACGGGPAGAGDPKGPAGAAQGRVPPSSTAPPATASPAPLPALPRLSLAQMAGQRVIYSYRGLTPPPALLRWIRRGEVGGVIFFSPNVASKAQVRVVVHELDRANASASNPLRAYPLLLMTDQEGGEVRRLPGPPLRSERQIGESAHPAAQAREAGAAAAENLADAGLNVDLAPVLDVYRTPGDFDDQFGRSYSMSPLTVSRLGRAFISAQQAAGVAATGKHFPGLGAAASSQDTDLRPVTLNVSRGQLRAVDEYPYRAAIAAGLKLVMVSWAVYPALDPQRPAGLSRAVVAGELRGRLGFRGVTITDALEAGALAPFGGIPRRAILAAQAGMDLILCSRQRPGEGRRAALALAAGYRGGALGRAAFTAALQRIVALRAGLRG
jgi:beta-N-acetylhexosaminidase